MSPLPTLGFGPMGVAAGAAGTRIGAGGGFLLIPILVLRLPFAR